MNEQKTSQAPKQQMPKNYKASIALIGIIAIIAIIAVVLMATWKLREIAASGQAVRIYAPNAPAVAPQEGLDADVVNQEGAADVTGATPS